MVRLEDQFNRLLMGPVEGMNVKPGLLPAIKRNEASTSIIKEQGSAAKFDSFSNFRRLGKHASEQITNVARSAHFDDRCDETASSARWYLIERDPTGARE